MSSPSAISKLADELWLDIFKSSTREAQLEWRCALPNQYPKPIFTTPFTLSAVNKDWRTICLANSSVWEAIYIRFPAYAFGDEDDSLVVTSGFITRVDALQLWIERAGERGLSISLDLHEKHMSVDFADEAATRIPHLIVERAVQVKQLDIFLSAEWYPLFNGIDFPILEKLKLWIPEMWPADGTFDSEITELSGVEGGPLDLTSCPRLLSVEVDGSYREHSHITLPWAQIREVHAGWIRPLVYPEILELMPNIQRCTLDGDAMYDTDFNFVEEDADQFQEMDRREGEWALEELKVVSMDPVIITALLDYSPLSLKRILLMPDGRSDHIDDATFLQSITPFSATLSSLTIHRYWFNDFDALVDALIQLNSLVSLQVRVGTEDRGLNDDFLAQTLCKSDVLPSLEAVSIKTTKLQFTGDILQLILTNRGYPKESLRARCAVLQELELTSTESKTSMEPVTPERAALLKGYVKGGLRLTIGHVGWDAPYGEVPLSPWFQG